MSKYTRCLVAKQGTVTFCHIFWYGQFNLKQSKQDVKIFRNKDMTRAFFKKAESSWIIEEKRYCIKKLLSK